LAEAEQLYERALYIYETESPVYFATLTNLSAGHPEILAALQNRTLRILIGADSNGLLKASCAILNSAPSKALDQYPEKSSVNLVTLLIATVIGCWLWSKLAMTNSTIINLGIGIGIAVLVILITKVESSFSGKHHRSGSDRCLAPVVNLEGWHQR